MAPKRCAGGPVGRDRGRPSGRTCWACPPRRDKGSCPSNSSTRSGARSAVRRGAVRALHRLAEHDADLSLLVHGPGRWLAGEPPGVPHPMRPDRPHAPGHGQPGPRGGGRPHTAHAPRGAPRPPDRPVPDPGPPSRPAHHRGAPALGAGRRLGRRQRVLQRDPFDDVDGGHRLGGPGPTLRRARSPLGHPVPHAPPAFPGSGPAPATGADDVRRGRAQGAQRRKPTSRSWRAPSSIFAEKG